MARKDTQVQNKTGSSENTRGNLVNKSNQQNIQNDEEDAEEKPNKMPGCKNYHMGRNKIGYCAWIWKTV